MQGIALAGALLALAGAAGQEQGQATMDDVQRELRALRQRVAELERAGALAQEGPVEQVDLSLDLQSAAPPGQGSLLNPAITVFLDMGASYSTNDDNKALNRFNLREIEVDFRAAVAPWADGVFILAFGEEPEIDAAGELEIDFELEIEEGYIDFHTIPGGLSLKGGKFRNAFGVNNLLHTHDLPQVDRPLAVQAFFGPEGLATIGASLAWLVTNPWDKYLDLTAEVFDADGGEESPILDGAGADNPAFLVHLKYNDNAGEYGYWEVGGSYLYARTSDDSDFDANIFGLDATLKLPDAKAPDRRSLLLQSEFFWAGNDVDDPAGPFRRDSFGFYAFGQYQFARDWYAGVRFDWTEFPGGDVPPGDETWALSPYLSWYLTEFLRLRFEYQHLEAMQSGVWNDEDNFFFELTFSIGAHPAHPYWVNR